MKAIHAYIKPHKLSQVNLTLHEIEGLTGMTVLDAKGFGRDRNSNKKGNAVDTDDKTTIAIEYTPHIKLEIICQDKLAKRVVSVIQETAHTGLPGDGKIYVWNIEEAVRIRTGERGKAAI